MANTSKQNLEAILLIIEQLVPWLVRSGIGYTEFSAALKPVFYRQAIKEAARTGQKNTDSAISLLSGLHRRDTASLRKAIKTDPSLSEAPVSKPVSVPKQVIARWLTQDIPETLLITDADNSFDKLVRQVSKDQHPRSILDELSRLGIVKLSKNAQNQKTVTLLRQAFIPNPSENEARELLGQNVADHIAAGVTNLFMDISAGETGVLEQAVFSDELSPASITELHTLANKLWFDTLDTVLKRAIVLHEQDKTAAGANQRFRLGMYAYHTEQPPIQQSDENNKGDTQ